jgi:DNA-binding MarR family transcriptional regulator
MAPSAPATRVRHERAGTDLDAIERAIEQLLRLYSSRKVHSQMASAARVVISQPGFSLIRRLQEAGELSIGELARLTRMDPAATGRQIRQLEEDGLVERTRDVDDGRVVMVRVTPEGESVRHRLGMVGERHLADVLSDWSATDCRQLAALLPRFVDGLRATPYRGDDRIGSRP